MQDKDIVLQIQKGVNVSDYLEGLYLSYKAVISAIAYKFSDRNDYDDLMQEGFLGLQYAATHFRAEEGIDFLYYAKKCIYGFILRYKLNDSIIRIPSFMHERISKYKAFVSAYRKENGKDPDDEMIMDTLGFTTVQKEDIRRVLWILNSTISIEQPASEEDDETIGDCIPDPDNTDEAMFDYLEKQELKKLLWDIVDHLKGIESEVIRKRFKEDKTLKQCGKDLGVSPERVRVIEASGLKRIRNTKERDLKPFLSDVVYKQGLKGTGLSAYKNNRFTSSVERDVIEIDNKLSKQ